VSRLRDRLTDGGYGAGWALAKRLPEPAARALFRGIADVTWRRRGDGVLQLEKNLRRVVPGATPAELRELSHAGMRSYMRYFGEAFRLPAWSHQHILDRMVLDNEHRLDEAHARGKGVIFALPHTANWDWAGAYIALRGHPFTTVAERLKPESLFERFVAYRESLGMEVLPLTGGVSTLGVLARRLREGRLICLLSDRDLTASGVPVTFFGEEARMAAGPAALAVQTGAALIPVTLSYEAPGMRAQLHPEVEVPTGGTRREKVASMTQSVADAYAHGIAAHPQDWHMLQPLWLADLDPARLKKAGVHT
jgi:KDO2-lipid IV(A) lauroyltransferase